MKLHRQVRDYVRTLPKKVDAASLSEAAQSDAGLRSSVVLSEAVVYENVQSKEEARCARHKRRADQTMAGGHYTPEEWLALLAMCNNQCLCCGTGQNLSADHVVAIARGGTSYINNIQVLCRSCNSSKGTKEIDYRVNLKK